MSSFSDMGFDLIFQNPKTLPFFSLYVQVHLKRIFIISLCPASLIRLDRFSQFLLLIWFLANRAEGSGEQKKWSDFSNGADWVCHFSFFFILLPFLNVRTFPSTASFQFELNSCSLSRSGHDEFLDIPLNSSCSIWEAYQWNSDLS